jgi:hypothetical protein
VISIYIYIYICTCILYLHTLYIMCIYCTYMNMYIDMYVYRRAKYIGLYLYIKASNDEKILTVDDNFNIADS